MSPRNTKMVFASSGIRTNLAYRQNGADAQKSGMVSENENPLFRARLKAGLTRPQLAKVAGTSPQQIERLEKVMREMTRTWADRLAPHIRASPVKLVFPDRSVPVQGYVGAGSEAHFYQDSHPLNEWVEAPDNATKNTVAVQIRGESLGPLFDRWFAYYDDVRDPPGMDMVGNMCVCGLTDGRVLIKKLKAGQDRTWTLLSNAELPIYDVELLWAAKVIDMRPPSALIVDVESMVAEAPPTKKRLQKPVSHIGQRKR